MHTIDFYFDPISPYAALAFERLPEALAGRSVAVRYLPIVFGAMLKSLDHKGPAREQFGYAVFGQVIEGMDVVDKIAKVECVPNQLGERATPKTDVVIKSIRRADKK